MCPVTLTMWTSSDEQRWFKSWLIFYQDLFKTKSLNHIILTLNRMMKNNSPKGKDGSIRNQKLFMKIKNLFLLKHKNIQSILPGEAINSSLYGSVKAIKTEGISISSLKWQIFHFFMNPSLMLLP